MSSPYARQAPHPQQTVDLFKGSWASRFPGDRLTVEAGQAALFEDPRIDWLAHAMSQHQLDLKESHFLDLGPLEGGHAYRLSRLGARAVTAVEAHPQAFLKCLVAKELLGIERVNFLYGDALAFLKESSHVFDVTVASGFLYHQPNPVELIEHLCLRSRAVFLWTVFWDPGFAERHPQQPAGSGPVRPHVHAGFSHTLHEHSYGLNVEYARFWGGGEAFANWMEGPEILAAFRHFGFTRQTVEFEDNPNGQALRLFATREG